jgi:hypothetical protein
LNTTHFTKRFSIADMLVFFVFSNGLAPMLFVRIGDSIILEP